MNQDVLNIIKYSIFGGEAPIVSDWGKAYDILGEHAILPLLWIDKRIDELDIPSHLLYKLEQQKMLQYRNYLRICAITGEITELLGKQGIKPIILKGMAAAAYHRDSAFRTVGDIDFLVRGEDRSIDEPIVYKGDTTDRISAPNDCFDRARRILTANGYKLTKDGAAVEVMDPRHDNLEKNGIKLEMHRYFSCGVVDSDRTIDEIIGGAKPVLRTVDDCSFYMLPDAVNGIVLIDHIHHHLKKGLGLRQIIDWLFFVETTLTDELWKDEFAELVCLSGLEALAVNVTRMCELYLGASHRAYAENADDTACTLLMEEILDAGNFGKSRDNVVNDIACFANSGNIFKRLQEGGMSRWTAAKKHKVLRPFAWLYQACRIAGVMIRRMVRGKSIKGAGELANRQDELFRALEIGKYRK